MGSLAITDLPQDMTKEEKESVLDFINNGCPGLLKVQLSDTFNLFQLYMAGKTYSELATTYKMNKTLIMYLAYKSKWMDYRFKHYEDLSLKILEKIKMTKLDIVNDLVVSINATGKYLREEYDRYLKTNDKSIIENLDQTIVTGHRNNIKVLKEVLTAEENSDPNKKPNQPLVNVNVGMGARATIEQTGEKTVEITDQTAGDFLKALAGMKKEQERK